MALPRNSSQFLPPGLRRTTKPKITAPRARKQLDSSAQMGSAAPSQKQVGRSGHIMGAGLGSLQPLFGGKPKLPSRSEVAETAGGVQTIAQLGNPKFVIRNILQHVAFGKQERAATRLAAAIDWGYSKVTGKGRQIAAPQGSDLAAYVRNWQKALAAHKAGQPLPGGHSTIAHTAN